MVTSDMLIERYNFYFTSVLQALWTILYMVEVLYRKRIILVAILLLFCRGTKKGLFIKGKNIKCNY